MKNMLSFHLVEIEGGALSITPCIDGKPLSSMIAEFEAANGYTDPVGGYGGLVPDYFNAGPLLSYLCAQVGRPGASHKDEEIYLLGCECGEVGCWPLMASVTRIGTGYQWSAFHQPHRSQRNYEGFGSFTFEQHQYENALRELVLKCEALD
jgi:hypothetical protein